MHRTSSHIGAICAALLLTLATFQTAIAVPADAGATIVAAQIA